jgi:ABC-2 type transport system ATP-binding protein
MDSAQYYSPRVTFIKKEAVRMNAIEIRGLMKNFGSKQAVGGLEMTVPMGAIYGFIGENGSGKSTTEKMVCGLLVPNGGSIKLFGRDYTDVDVRAKVGVLIEAPGCFPNYSLYNPKSPKKYLPYVQKYWNK